MKDDQQNTNADPIASIDIWACLNPTTILQHCEIHLREAFKINKPKMAYSRDAITRETRDKLERDWRET